MPDPYLWGLDEETGGISPLPASPLLLPAVVLAAIWGIVCRVATLDFSVAVWTLPPAGVDRAQYHADKKAYQVALARYAKNPSWSTLEDLKIATYPDWAPNDWEWTQRVAPWRVAKGQKRL